MAKPMKKGDWGALVFGAAILAGSLCMSFLVNGSAFSRVATGIFLSGLVVALIQKRI